MLAEPPAAAPRNDRETRSARRQLALALAAQAPDALAAWLDAHPLSLADLEWLQAQGLALFAFHRMQQADLLDRAPAGVIAPWQEAYQRVVTATAAMDWEIERVLLALQQAGVDFIWLKGAALAYAVYANPACRLRGDLDLWIQPEQLPLAAAVLADLGFRLASKEDRPDALVLLVGGEQQLVGDGTILELIELQWPVLRGEWVRHTTAIDHQAIWQRRAAIALGEHGFPTLTPEDTLLHLAQHQAISHQFSAPWLRNLLDVHLLVAAGRLNWPQATATARSWRLATVLWTVLHLAQRLLDTPAPPAAMQALAPPPWQRWLIDHLHLEEALLTMQSGGYGHRRFLIQIALIDRVRDVVRLLARGLFPDADWLRARYGLTPGARLARWRLLHIWRLATAARA
ncbi:MAG TPA: nucleotidyltransferase family protein [Anaerolineae bacterium]|nr:nucleotidyltransferase family protein [Anaerolineae bacterium]HNU04697.1 nucleotidyltransferase family protein [Anaerolineae bacterium]